MSEENTPEVKVDSVEDKAREMGWKPQEDFDGEESDFIGAEEFVRRAPLFQKIEAEKRSRQALEKQVEATTKALRELGEHNKKLAKTEYEKALKHLKAERRAALQEGEVLLADEIQERIDTLKPEIVPEVPTVDHKNQVLTDWIDRNSWYKEDLELQGIADGLGQAAIKQGKQGEEILNFIEKRMKERNLLPGSTQRNANKDSAPHVEGRTGTTSGKKASTFRPTDEQRRFAKAFAQSGVMTEAEYYQQLQEMDD